MVPNSVVVALLVGAFFKLLSDELHKRLIHAAAAGHKDRSPARRPTIVVDVNVLDMSAYRRFVDAVGAARNLKADVCVRQHRTLELPSHWLRKAEHASISVGLRRSHQPNDNANRSDQGSP